MCIYLETETQRYNIVDALGFHEYTSVHNIMSLSSHNKSRFALVLLLVTQGVKWPSVEVEEIWVIADIRRTNTKAPVSR